MPPEKMKRIIVESARVRILNEAKTLVCTACWKYVETRLLKNVARVPRCPECRSRALGVSAYSEEKVESAILKRDTRHTEKEERILNQLRETAKLVGKFGKAAVLAFGARGVSVDQAEDILQREKRVNQRFFESVVEAEREALRERFLR